MAVLTTVTDWEFKNICIPRFLESFEEVGVHSLEDIVKFNEANKEKCLPEREFLLTKILPLLNPNSVHRAKRPPQSAVQQ